MTFRNSSLCITSFRNNLFEKETKIKSSPWSRDFHPVWSRVRFENLSQTTKKKQTVHQKSLHGSISFRFNRFLIPGRVAFLSPMMRMSTTAGRTQKPSLYPLPEEEGGRPRELPRRPEIMKSRLEESNKKTWLQKKQQKHPRVFR